MSSKNIHHLGLAVKDLNVTTDFFTQTLGFSVVKELSDYPAKFISNGHAFLTLWQTAPGARDFDRRSAVGLHHFALKMESEQALNECFNKASQFPGVVVEFAPEAVGDSGALHAMLFEPGGLRLELIWPGQ